MSDMRSTIVPKSDQQNFDDFVGGQTKTIKITGVKILGGDQPVALSFEGDEGKPYKPGKSMRRVLVHVWGENGNAYIGRSLKLYGDPSIKFGGMAVGGIRISHMSDITEPITMPLTETRGKKKQYTVEPLIVTQQKKKETAPTDPSIFAKAIERVQKSISEAELDEAIMESRTLSKTHNWSKANDQQMKIAIDAQRAAIKQLSEERQPGE